MGIQDRDDFLETRLLVRGELDKLTKRAGGALKRSVDAKATALSAQVKLLSSLGYREVLSRGYALVLDADGALRAEARPDPALRGGYDDAARDWPEEVYAELRGP